VTNLLFDPEDGDDVPQKCLAVYELHGVNDPVHTYSYKWGQFCIWWPCEQHYDKLTNITKNVALLRPAIFVLEQCYNLSPVHCLGSSVSSLPSDSFLSNHLVLIQLLWISCLQLFAKHVAVIWNHFHRYVMKLLMLIKSNNTHWEFNKYHHLLYNLLHC
jgi:hypothetical protein